MAKKHIIFVHGRWIKPSATRKKKLMTDAIMHGLMHASPKAAKAITNGKVKCSFAYYGDINNEIMAAHDEDVAALLTASNNKKYGGGPCQPYGPLAKSLKTMLAIGEFNESTYNKVVAEHKDLRALDNLARMFSNFLSVMTRNKANEIILARSSEDMSAYLMSRKTGSEIRERLQAPLRRAFMDRDEICLISHSMGCLVAYDVLWKFSQMSEYKHLRKKKPKISLWMTLGCPLGEAGVRGNLYDAGEHAGGRFPRAIVKDWLNMAAYDDFIAHDPHMADDFKEMLEYGYVDSITDKRIYNCWVHNGSSNPHKLYGYLANQDFAKELANWINR